MLAAVHVHRRCDPPYLQVLATDGSGEAVDLGDLVEFYKEAKVRVVGRLTDCRRLLAVVQLGEGR